MGTLFYRCMVFAACAALFAARPAMGQDARGDGGDLPKKVRLTGTVAKEKLVRVARTGIQHQVLLLETKDAGRVPVDLGESGQVQELNITTGTVITAYGTMMRVGDRDVLFVDDVEAAGKKVHVKRIVPGRISTVAGCIVSTQELTVQEGGGPGARNLVAAVRTKDGATVVADLGSAQDLGSVSVSPGRQIELQGVLAGIGGHMVLLAEQFTTQGKTVRIVRPRAGAAPEGG